MKLDELISKYIELRDKKAQLKADYSAKAARIDEVLEKIEAKVLDVFDSAGIDSTRTQFGTAYTSKRTTATIADKETFMEFVKKEEAWPMIIARANSPVIDQYVDSTGEVPPGLDFRTERTINVRRA